MTFLSSISRFNAALATTLLPTRSAQTSLAQNNIKEILTSPQNTVSKRVTIFLALHGLPEKQRLVVEKKIPEEYLLSKKLRLPPEIQSTILIEALSHFTPFEIALITMQTEGQSIQLSKAGYHALYKKYDWLNPKWVTSHSEFTALIDDARRYGSKTFTQIFDGLNLLKSVQEADPNFQINITHLQRAGILQKDWIYPDMISTSQFVQNKFLAWIRANPASIMACLRWLPTQRGDIPFLLTEATKHRNLSLVQSVFEFMVQHRIPLSENTLHKAINNACFEVVKLLVDKGVSIESSHEGKTAIDVAVSALSMNFFEYYSSTASRKKGGNLINILIYLIRKEQEQNIPFNTSCKPERMSLLHVACYVRPPALQIPLATLFIEHDPTILYARENDVGEEDGNTPLHLAITKKQYEMIELLLQKGADVTARAQGYTVIELAEKVGYRKTLRILHNTGNTGSVSDNQFDWLYPQWVSTRAEFKALIQDARTYGGKTSKQIFEGFNILKLIQQAGPHAQITTAHFQRAGILKAGWAHPDNIQISKFIQTQFLEWLQANPAHILACLRWLPAQSRIPAVLTEIVKLGKVSVVQSAAASMEQHIEPLDKAAALEQAVKNANVHIAHYLFNNGTSIQDLPKNILHKAVQTGCLEMVELLVEKGANLNEKGPGLPILHDGKTATELAVSAIDAQYFSTSKANRRYGLNRIQIASYLIQKMQEQNIPFDIQSTPNGMTLLHAACYIKPQEKGLELAKLLFKQGKNNRHIGDTDISYKYPPLYTGKNTPIYISIKEKHYPLAEFLFNEGTDITLSPLEYIILRFRDPQAFRILQTNKKYGCVYIEHGKIVRTLISFAHSIYFTVLDFFRGI